MTIVLATCMVILALSAVMVTVRVILGPSTLDRAIALDVMVSILICALAVQAAFRHDASFLPILLVLSLVGFAGSVTIARFSESTSKQSENN